MTVSDEVRLLPAVDSVQVVYRTWLPEGAVRAIVQIVHGASEHSGRYGRLADALTVRGLGVYAMGLRRPRPTAESSGVGRYGGTDRGVDAVLRDVARLHEAMTDEHP